MDQDEYNEAIRHAMANFERQHGRVPSINELAHELGADPAALKRKLRKAMVTLGMDAQIDGTSAFKSTLREILSSGLVMAGAPGEDELANLNKEAQDAPGATVELTWSQKGSLFKLEAISSGLGRAPVWTLWYISPETPIKMWSSPVKDTRQMAHAMQFMEMPSIINVVQDENNVLQFPVPNRDAD